jgi:hypothetical protein
MGEDSLVIKDQSDLAHDLNVLLTSVYSQLRIGPESWLQGGALRDDITSAARTVQACVQGMAEKGLGLEYYYGDLATFTGHGEPPIVKSKEFVGFKRQGSGSGMCGSQEAPHCKLRAR